MTALSTVAATSDMTGTYLNYLWVSLAIIALLCALIWLGWRNRKRRQSAIPSPDPVPETLLQVEPAAAAEGMVIGTVSAQDYLDRVAVHQLGLRTTGRLEVHDAGVVILRSGARNWLIPASDITHVRTDRGVVGKFVERDGALIIGWQLGPAQIETAFRPRRAQEGHTVLEALKSRTAENPLPEEPPHGHPPENGPHAEQGDPPRT